MPGKCDVGVSFRHMFCIRHMASQIMHHVNDVVRCVLYLFYFLALPFFYPFIRQLLILSNSCPFARKKLWVSVSVSVSGEWWVMNSCFVSIVICYDQTDMSYICRSIYVCMHLNRPCSAILHPHNFVVLDDQHQLYESCSNLWCHNFCVWHIYTQDNFPRWPRIHRYVQTILGHRFA